MPTPTGRQALAHAEAPGDASQSPASPLSTVFWQHTQAAMPTLQLEAIATPRAIALLVSSATSLPRQTGLAIGHMETV